MLRVTDPQAERDAPERLVDDFRALLEDADKDGFMKLLGVGRFPPGPRKRMEPVFTALCCGLWRLAMRRAMPDHCERAYALYVDSLWSNMEDADSYAVLLRDLEGCLPRHGDEDFTPAARELLRRGGCGEEPSRQVGTALFLRRLYEYFFNHLR